MIKKVWSKRLEDWGYKADIRLGGRRVRLPANGVFASDRQARDAIAQARAEHGRQEFLFPADRQTVTLDQARAGWIESRKELHATPDHLRVIERAFELLGELIPLSSSVEELTTATLKQFIERREASPRAASRGASRATSFKDLIQIRAACSAVGHLVETPAGIERPKSHRDRVITAEEERSIVAALRDGRESNMADLFEIALGTGMRAGEIFGLRWSDIRPAPSRFEPHGSLIVRGTKTGRRSAGQKVETADRPVPMTERVARLVSARYNGEVMVFPTRFDHAGKLEAACERVGIGYGRATPGGLVFHDTRHTAGTRMLQDGVDVKTVAAILGHKNLATTFIYTHATPESLSRAIKALDGGRGGE